MVYYIRHTELMNALFQGVVIRLHIYVDSLICLALVFGMCICLSTLLNSIFRI